MTTRAEHGLPDLPPGRPADGGPAFPQIDWKRKGDIEWGTTRGGMSLRDYFAAQAMRGIMSSLDDGEEPEIEAIAHDAYRMADHMLAERAK